MNTIIKPSNIFVTLYFLFALQLSATTYYVDSYWGNDSASGSSIASPWRTINKINNSSFQHGDSVLFIRGGIWKESLNFPSSGNAFAPIVIGSYGDGELPIITGVDKYEGWNNSANWTLEKNNIWSRYQSYNPQRLWIDGKEVLRNEVIDSLDGTRYMWAWENSKIYIYSTQNPAVSFNSIETNFLYEPVIIQNKYYLTIQELDIQGGYVFAMAIQGCARVTVKDCRIGSYARQGIQIRDIQGVSSIYVTIDNCILDSKYSFSYGKNKGIDDGIQITSGANDCVVKNCEIKDFGHTGVYIKAVSSTDNGVFNNKIYGNLITAKNVTYLHGIGTDGYENKCRDNEFFNNIIKDTNVRSQINGNNNWIHHNIVDNVKNSIVRTWGVGQAFDLQGYGTDLVCHDNKIDNNLIMNCDEPGITFSGNGNAKENNYIRNNIIINCGRNSISGYDNLGIVIKDASSIKTNFFYNNCIYNNDEDSPIILARGKYFTAEEFNSQNSKIDVAANNIQKDPLLEILDSLNFYLTENSPCIDAGIDVGLSFDYYGNSIFSGNAPDIGIHEFSSPTNVSSQNNSIVSDFKLFQNYPNPFNPTTQITYQIPKDGFVKIVIYNSLGEKVALPVNQYQVSGKYSIKFNGTNLSSGIYFYKIISGSFTKINKMVLLR